MLFLSSLLSHQQRSVPPWWVEHTNLSGGSAADSLRRNTKIRVPGFFFSSILREVPVSSLQVTNWWIAQVRPIKSKRVKLRWLYFLDNVPVHSPIVSSKIPDDFGTWWEEKWSGWLSLFHVIILAHGEWLSLFHVIIILAHDGEWGRLQ